VHPTFHYSGRRDPTRESNDRVDADMVFKRVSQFFDVDITNLGVPKSYSLYNPAPDVSFSFIIIAPSASVPLLMLKTILQKQVLHFLSSPPLPGELFPRPRRTLKLPRALWIT